MSTKEERIANCGKIYKWTLSPRNGGLWVKVPLYCRYINECDACRSRETFKRKKRVENVIESASNIFRCEIDKNDWNKLYQKLKRDDINFIRIPRDDDSFLIISENDPKHKSFCFVEYSPHTIIEELALEENLFPTSGNRSSSSAWSLTPEIQIDDNTESNEQQVIEIKLMEPIFSNDTHGYKVPYDDLYGLVKACNTWSNGKVTKDNAQEFVTNSVGTLIALHLAAGYTWNKDESRIVTKTIKVSDIDNWKVHSVKYSERAFFGKDEEGNRLTKDTFYGRDEQVLAVVQGVVDIPDRIAELEEYKENNFVDDFDLFFSSST